MDYRQLITIESDKRGGKPCIRALRITVYEDMDRLELSGSFRALGRGIAGQSTPTVPRYAELVAHVFENLGWDPGAFRAYRYLSDYPLYGSQVVAAFPPSEDPATP